MFVHIREVLTKAEVESVRKLLLGGSFEDGRATATGHAAAVKRNLQLAADPNIRKQVDQIVMQAIMNHPRFGEVTFPKGMVPPTYNKYDPGMEYGLHVDAPFLNMGRLRADISFTLFLAEPEAYDGGDLILLNNDAETRVKCPAGDMVTYPTTSLHRVAPVSQGSRLAAVGWVQSYVPDPQMRQILVDLHDVKNYFDAQDHSVPAADSLRNGLFNLTRMWWQP